MPYRWTLLTCAFSHEGAAHIFVNAFTFYFMAPPVLGALGKRAFFVLYLGGEPYPDILPVVILNGDV